MALLESNIVQIDERKFLLTQPDGISRQFWRKTPNDALLQGQGGWKGEIKGNSIALWAECGWKFTFVDGKNTSITTPKNRTLTLIQTSGKTSEIRENGKSVLKVNFDPASGFAKELRYGSNLVGLEMGEKPRVDVIQGLPVI